MAIKKVLWISIIAFLYLSCKDVSSHISVEKVSIIGDESCLAGEAIQLTVSILPEDATDKLIRWSSNDNSLANVNEYGMVQSLSPGTVEITASADNGNVKDVHEILIEERTGSIIFRTEGDSFSPRITVNGNPSILWEWSDGTTDSSTEPEKDFGTIATRVQVLTVDPWSSVERINIGYGGEDGGSDWDNSYPPAESYKSDQNVSSIEGLDVVAPSLERWYSSYNQIETLDFSNFTALTTVECYQSSSLSSVLLSNNFSLMRLCLEDGIISNELHLNECPSLIDLRGALNNYTNINWGSSNFQYLWHLCVRENAFTEATMFNGDISFPALEELLIWNTNQSGDLIIGSTGTSGTVYINGSNNSYERLDLRGSLQNNSAMGGVILNSNSLNEVIIDGCTQITAFHASSNNLDQTEIDYILETIESFNRSNTGGELPYAGSNYTIDLTGNSSPSASGETYADALRSRSWTVLTD